MGFDFSIYVSGFAFAYYFWKLDRNNFCIVGYDDFIYLFF